MIRTAALLATTLLPLAALAAPERYDIDPSHTFPSFEFPHMGISTWRGKFDRTKGSIVLDRAAKTGTVDITVDVASINFGLASMQEHAVSADWFDTAMFPQATYKGRIVFEGDAPRWVDGEVTIRDVKKSIRLAILSFKCIPHPVTKKETCGADAEGETNWSEYGMAKSQFGKGDAGRTKLRIQVEARKAD